MWKCVWKQYLRLHVNVHESCISTPRLSSLPSCRPQISSWRTGEWGLVLWSRAGRWTRACSSSWWGCWRRPSRSRWSRVCSGRAGGRSPCRGLTWRWGRPSPPPPSARRRPAASAAECCSTWTTRRHKGGGLRELLTQRSFSINRFVYKSSENSEKHLL